VPRKGHKEKDHVGAERTNIAGPRTEKKAHEKMIQEKSSRWEEPGLNGAPQRCPVDVCGEAGGWKKKWERGNGHRLGGERETLEGRGRSSKKKRPGWGGGGGANEPVGMGVIRGGEGIG